MLIGLIIAGVLFLSLSGGIVPAAKIIVWFVAIIFVASFFLVSTPDVPETLDKPTEPTKTLVVAVDDKHDLFIAECLKYAFSKAKCEAIWKDEI